MPRYSFSVEQWPCEPRAAVAAAPSVLAARSCAGSSDGECCSREPAVPGAGAHRALPQVVYRARPALACIIGARRAWILEMISSEEIPCR
jgi:hypothetical protein